MNIKHSNIIPANKEEIIVHMYLLFVTEGDKEGQE